MPALAKPRQNPELKIDNRSFEEIERDSRAQRLKLLDALQWQAVADALVRTIHESWLYEQMGRVLNPLVYAEEEWWMNTVTGFNGHKRQNLPDVTVWITGRRIATLKGTRNAVADVLQHELAPNTVYHTLAMAYTVRYQPDDQGIYISWAARRKHP